MKILANLYRRIHRSRSPSRFNRLYWLDGDPYGVDDSQYERCKQHGVVRLVQRRYHRNALDVGCGTGSLTLKLAPYCKRILGIDFSENAVSIARKRCKDEKHISFLAEDIRTFSTIENFDLLVCSEVLYYLEREDLQRVMLQFAALSSSDAWLILVEGVRNKLSFSRMAHLFQPTACLWDYQWDRPFFISVFHGRNSPQLGSIQPPSKTQLV